MRAKCFHTLDAFVRLLTLLVKESGIRGTANYVTKVNLLNKVLGIVAGVLIIDHEVRSTGFQQVPYHRYSSLLNWGHVATIWNFFGRLTWFTLGRL